MFLKIEVGIFFIIYDKIANLKLQICYFVYLPETGVEPAHPLQIQDSESCVSTNSTTRTSFHILKQLRDFFKNFS